MPLNYIPLSWKNVDPLNRDQMKVFLLQLSDFLNSAFNPAFLSFFLNGQALLQASSLKVVDTNLGSQSTNQTVACDGATSVCVNLISSVTAITLTLTHLSNGVPVVFIAKNTNAANCTFKLAATNPSGTAYTVTAVSTTGAVVDFTGTGVSIGTGLTDLFPGNSTSDNTLWLGVV